MPRCCKGARMPILLAAAIIALVTGRQGARADESGISFWLPGQYGSLAATPTTPGWALGAIYYHTRLRGASNKKARETLAFRPRRLEWLHR